MIDAISDAWLFPSNARRPVTISYSTAPSAKMSVRASASTPSSCSGAMYWNVPRIVPSAVSGVRGSCVGAFIVNDDDGASASTPIRARPKSKSFTPLRVSITFPGFRSRCTTPLRCAAASASAI